MTQRLLNLFRCINNTWKKCRLLVIWEFVEMLQIERPPINRSPNRSLQMLKWSRLLRHVSRRVERYWIFVRNIIMSFGNFFLLNKFRKCIIWRNTMVINFVKRWKKDKEWKSSMMEEDICHRAMWRSKYGWNGEKIVLSLSLWLYSFSGCCVW